jgi:hypothetical protein
MVLELREADRQRGVGLPPGGSETNPGQISSLITELLYRAIPSVGVQTVETVTPSAGAYQVTFRLTDYVRPVLRERVVQTGETAAFYVREGHRRICLYRHSSRQTFRHNVEKGAELPLDRGAAARVGHPHGVMRSAGGGAKIVRSLRHTTRPVYRPAVCGGPECSDRHDALPAGPPVTPPSGRHDAASPSGGFPG